MSNAVLTDYLSVQDYLFSLKSKGVKFGIDRMRLLTEALGHPERRYPVIHVAGTNGKGSVSAMLESIFRHAGRRTGLYTSPHLVKLGERVQVDRQILTEAEIMAYANELRPIAEKLGAIDPDDHPSFFEFMTAMAFLQFARQHVDVGVIEVGLGGRLDATNAVTPEVSVITSIGLDHTEMLGDTFAKIAAEKAGIIKPEVPVVIGRLPAEAEDVVRAEAKLHRAPVYSVRENFGESVDRYPKTNLEGDYQRWNAATATLVCEVLQPDLKASETDIAKGLADVSWPGRWQRVRVGEKAVILDASHNPEGAAVLETNLRKLFAETGKKPVIVTGALGELRARALIEVISRHAREIYLIIPNQQRASSYETLEGFIPPSYTGAIHRTTVARVFPRRDVCTVGNEDETVVVTGSIYLLGEVLERIETSRGTGEGKLQDF